MPEKEIGKLLEFLNEYAPDDFNWCVIDGKIYDKTMDYGDIPVNVEMGVYIISKQFGFIKWLVEKDKIDFEGMSGHANIIKYLRDVKKCNRNQIKEGVVLMLLSISSSPIEDLISYLK